MQRALPVTSEAWRDKDYCGGSKATADLSRVKKPKQTKKITRGQASEKICVRKKRLVCKEGTYLLGVGVEKRFNRRVQLYEVW